MKTRALLMGMLAIVYLGRVATAETVFYEQTFDGPDLPSDWTFDTDGEWSIIDGTLDQGAIVTTPGHADAWAGDLGWQDYSVEMDFRFVEFGSHNMEAGLGLRRDQFEPGGSFVVSRVSWRGEDAGWNLEIVRTLAPETHIPLGQELVEGAWYTMRAEIEDSYLRVWVNGLPYDIGDVNLDAYTVPSSGGIGVWTNNAHVQFDNVVVRGAEPIPEPSTAAMLGLGIAALGLARRRGSGLLRGAEKE